MNEQLCNVLLRSPRKPFGLHEERNSLIEINFNLLGSYYVDGYILYSLLDMNKNKVVYIKQYSDCYMFCGEEFE